MPLGVAGITCILASLLRPVLRGEELLVSHAWVPQLGLSVDWRVDGLSLLLAGVVSGVGVLVTLYTGWYLHEPKARGRLHALLLAFMASMLGLVLADNLILLYVFWELTSITSYFLIGFEHQDKEARLAARAALLVTTGGGLALLAGVVLLGDMAGTYRLSQVSEVGGEPVAVILLLLLAAFTKSAQLPFHFWLPRAMKAPAPVSAYLHAAAMVKAGVYLAVRMNPLFHQHPLWHTSLLWVGGASAVLGGALALYERHYKRVLAYSTVSALGLMMALVGAGTPAALEAMLVFLVAHALYKGALFLVAGAVDHTTGDLDLESLQGLRLGLPFTTAAAAMAALSMGGVPLALGFVSKELIYESTHGLLTASAFATEALFLAVAIAAGVAPFWRRHRGTRPSTEPVPWPMWAPPLALAGGGMLLGVWPGALNGITTAALSAVHPGPTPLVHLAVWHGMTFTFALSLATLALGAGLFVTRGAFRRAAAPLSVLAPWGPARTYDMGIRGLMAVARGVTRYLQRGYLRVYLLVIVCTTMGLVTITLAGQGVLQARAPGWDLRAYHGVLGVCTLAATLAAVVSRSRLAAIISLGVVGYGIALTFIVMGAPDLGITQLMVETLTVILLVLAFYGLPQFTVLSPKPAQARDILVSLGFGTMMTLLLLGMLSFPHPEPVSEYYGQVSRPLAHGRNVVNVILTDFRALDTLGEITVIATAAFGVVALLTLHVRGDHPR